MMNFPVGYRDLHPDPSFNYELNRWLTVLPEPELRTLAGRIDGREDWCDAMLESAASAHSSGRTIAAAFYYRAAEFYLPVNDRRKAAAYERFRELFYSSPEADRFEALEADFATGRLPILVRQPSGAAKDTVVLHGGFDSFMEEFFQWAELLAGAGYRVVLFEGPGQGAVLRHHGLVMTPEWEHPVAAVLDSLAIDECTLLGVSLGGYLAPRAAAHEPRIRRVILCDVLDDFFDCFAARAGAAVARTLELLARFEQRRLLNAMMRRAAAGHADSEWALAHGMEVSGARDPYEFVRWLLQLRTASFSSRLTQDVLVLAGAGDHIVPLRQFYRQAEALTGVRSFTGRIFTAAEAADSHCQIGNLGLLLQTIVAWLDLQIAVQTRGLLPRATDSQAA